MENRFYIYIGDGNTVKYTIPAYVWKELCYVNGCIMNQNTDYTVTGNTVTFDTAPADGMEVRLDIYGYDEKELHGIGYDVRHEYEVPINKHGVPFFYVTWCSENCKEPWGWYFKDNDDDLPIMTFKNEKDAFMFSITHGVAPT